MEVGKRTQPLATKSVAAYVLAFFILVFLDSSRWTAGQEQAADKNGFFSKGPAASRNRDMLEQLAGGSAGHLARPQAAAASLGNGTCPRNWQYLYFLHIQKTAGTYYAVTTLAEAMKQRGQAWCPKFALPEATYRNCRHNPELSKIAGSVGVAARALYPRRCAGLSSHHDMGLAGALLGEEERSKTLFLTLLRDPVDRVISEYYYYRSYHNLFININIPNILNDTDFAGLLTYARLVGRRNLMTHLLAGASECQWSDGAGQPSRTLGAAGAEPAALLSAAQARLGEFCWVGLQERMRESHALLAAALGVEGLQYQARYINRQKAHPAVPAAVRREIAALNHLDVALYNHGARLFQQRYEAAARSGLLSPP